MLREPEKRTSQLTWVIISACGVILFMGCAAVLISISHKTGSIKPQIYYFLLVIISLVTSGFLFGALRSHAKYSGKVYNGTLELGGPAVMFVIVIWLGIKLVPQKTTFNLTFTVFGSADKSTLVGNGLLKVLLDKPDSVQILNGYAEFSDTPVAWQGTSVTVIPVVSGYYVQARQVAIPVDGAAIELYLKARPDSISVRGFIINAAGQPVQGADINIANGLYTCVSNQDGNFKLIIPVKEGTELPLRVYYHHTLSYNNTQVLSAKAPLTLQLQ